MSYAQISSQLSMALDKTRNKVYLAALKKVITPKSVVLDLGAGLGPFGMLAAKLGAKRVYLVEPQPLVHTVNNVAKANGLQDRVVCIQGKIEDIDLPEKVDVIVSCFTGNFLLSEDLLPSLFYARDHYLKPGGKLIPDSGRMVAVPVCAPKAYKHKLASLSKPHLGIDYSYYRKFEANSIKKQRAVKPNQYLANPVPLMTLDFTKASKAECNITTNFDIHTSADCHGFLGWFDMTLGEQILSSAPDDPVIHWCPLWFPTDPPIPVSKSHQLTINIIKSSKIPWSWTLQTNEVKQLHSSGFVAMNLKALSKSNPQQQGTLSLDAQQLLFVLKALNQGWQEARIIEQICENWPDNFTRKQAIKYVGEQKNAYCA